MDSDLRGLIRAVRGPRPLAECGLSPSQRGAKFKVEAAQSLPAMTGLNSPSGHAVSASTSYSGTFLANGAFNQNLSDAGWSSGNGSHEPCWLRRDFPAPLTIGAYRITPWDEGRSPREWRIEYDGPSGSPVVVDRQFGQTGWTVSRYFKLRRPVTADHLRLYIETINGATIATIVELELFQVVK